MWKVIKEFLDHHIFNPKKFYGFNLYKWKYLGYSEISVGQITGYIFFFENIKTGFRNFHLEAHDDFQLEYLLENHAWFICDGNRWKLGEGKPTGPISHIYEYDEKSGYGISYVAKSIENHDNVIYPEFGKR